MQNNLTTTNQNAKLALLKSKNINLETLQFISFYFPYEREDDADSDSRDENKDEE